MDTHGYLLGIHAFVHRGDRHLVPGSLSAASFWIGLRQEIYSAVMNHQPVRMPLVHSLVDRSLNVTDDYTWSNRAITHCADVLNFCFGDNSQPVGMRWSELDTWNKQWCHSIPESFTPIYRKDRTGNQAFPEIWYQSGCNGMNTLLRTFCNVGPELITTPTVIGVQHHLLAELFLACFDPKLPRIGGSRREADRRVEVSMEICATSSVET